jgi:transcription initiation factor TFIID TATA-box-binding protein
MVKVAIVNVIATADMNQEVDLFELAEYKEILYDSEIYGGRVAYFKSPSMEGKVSIFTSGKMISIGTKSEREAFHELNQVKKFLVKKHLIADSVRLVPRVQNIVVTADFEKTINLEELSTDQKMIYEPEQFPGGILRVEEPHNTTILLFASGKAVIVGLKRSEQIKPVVTMLSEIIRHYTT